MTDHNTYSGGPAFPTTKPLDSWGDPNQGMTLRDYFAAQAFAMLMHPHANDLSPKATAEEAYRFADAMLEARK